MFYKMSAAPKGPNDNNPELVPMKAWSRTKENIIWTHDGIFHWNVMRHELIQSASGGRLAPSAIMLDKCRKIQ